MAMPSYLRDEDEEEDDLPFLGGAEDDEEDDDDPQRPRPFGSQEPDTPPAPDSGPRTTVTPELQRILGGGKAETPSVVQKAADTREALAREKGYAPPLPEPKWWQRLGAAAVGGLAGYVNADGKRHPQIDPTGAEQAIMGVPQYQRRVALHEQAVAGKKAEADAAAADELAWWKNRQLGNQEGLQAAQSERARKQGNWYEGRNDASVQRGRDAANERLDQQVMKQYGDDAQLQRESDPVPPGYETTRAASQPGMVFVHPPKFMPMPADLAPYAMGRKAGDVVPYSEIRRAQDRAGKDTLQQNKPERTRNLVNVAPGHSVFDPETNKTVYTAPGKSEDEQKPATRRQMTGIESKKGDRLNAAERNAKQQILKIQSARITGANGAQEMDPVKIAKAQQEQKAAVFADLESQKQQIQNEYEGEVQAATGNYPGHLELSEAQPKVTHGTPNGAHVFPRSRLAGFAAANGLSAAQAEQQLKAGGYQIQ